MELKSWIRVVLYGNLLQGVPKTYERVVFQIYLSSLFGTRNLSDHVAIPMFVA
jgi:hypothetical protein